LHAKGKRYTREQWLKMYKLATWATRSANSKKSMVDSDTFIG